jgi:hypothetical protein
LKYICFFLIILFLPISGSGQYKDSAYAVSAEGSFVLGGKISRNTLIPRTGPFVNVSMTRMYYQRMYLGFGVGVMGLEDEVFIPAFINLRVKMNSNPSGFYFGMKTGYSIGYNPKATAIEGTSYRGGWLAQPGFGYTSRLSEQLNFNLGFQLIYQQGLLTREFETTQINNKERLRFTLFGIMCGFSFK